MHQSHLEESGIPAGTFTETYVAIQAELENWRWSGVPFYLRTGKRLAERVADIVVNFRSVPHSIFPSAGRDSLGNQLVIQLLPGEGLKLFMMGKVPGDTMNLRPVGLNLDFAAQFKHRPMQAYERLLIDAIRGDLTPFMRRDEFDAAGRWCEPMLDGWAASDEKPGPCNTGSWGPAASSALVGRDGAIRREESRTPQAIRYPQGRATLSGRSEDDANALQSITHRHYGLTTSARSIAVPIAR